MGLFDAFKGIMGGNKDENPNADNAVNLDTTSSSSLTPQGINDSTSPSASNSVSDPSSSTSPTAPVSPISENTDNSSEAPNVNSFTPNTNADEPDNNSDDVASDNNPKPDSVNPSINSSFNDNNGDGVVDNKPSEFSSNSVVTSDDGVVTAAPGEGGGTSPAELSNPSPTTESVQPEDKPAPVDPDKTESI